MTGLQAAATVLLLEREAADYLRLQPRTLQDWRVRGVGPRYLRLTGRGVRYRQSDLDAFLESRERTSTSDDAA